VPNNRLPAEVIDYWPEVFKDVEIKSVPVKYILGVHVTFTDGKSWDIDIDKEKAADENSLEDTLNTFFQEYNELIERIEFKLDTPNIVNDVKAKTKTFMKRS
jgi:hypothetical protein|tara:strand:+ start:153 stop:458 length:306 start_codon:yes stop_codon:yes gene_type:complete